MDPNSLSTAQLALARHVCSTKRLILRDIRSDEVPRFRRILVDPKNSYPGIDPKTPENTESSLLSDFEIRLQGEDPEFALFIVLKPGLEVPANILREPEKHSVNDGHVIGFVTLTLSQHPNLPSQRGVDIGIVIHHEATGHGFGKEAMTSVLDYVLNDPKVLPKGDLSSLGMSEAFVETAVANGALRGLIESLHLQSCEQPGESNHAYWGRLNVPFVIYIITKSDWANARKYIRGQPSISGDGLLDFQTPVHGSASGSE